jgi:hypothetical protein
MDKKWTEMNDKIGLSQLITEVPSKKLWVKMHKISQDTNREGT